ncbi:DUF2267 domain-containing protein [Micromonospora cremea]|uniref:Uncharacterized conserved protein, DUF2267 family n=1 Tax=Micromonospora cremea TaxID=709881 RepID=A0A1N5UQK2_9ACTN|nr:DUF2267 domain-containing protein [Micromonospora cremea]SIM62507.1 Uncharacterized conserved protein, DUF2267 family [Micromonospora cremea]
MTDRAGGGQFPHFIDAVSRRSGLPTEQAAAVARAVLQTMAERVTGGPPDPLAGHLPDDLDGYLADPAPPAVTAGPDGGVAGPDTGVAGLDGGVAGPDSGVGLDVGGTAAAPPAPDAGPVEFLRRVGQRAGVDPTTARTGTGAVFATLREAVTVQEFREMVARLPRDSDGAVAPAPSDPYGH